MGGAVPQHLPDVLVSLVDYVRDGSEKVPVLLGYGEDIAISAVSYDPSRVTLSANYSVVKSDESADGTRRQMEFGLSSTQGWDVQLQIKTQTGGDSTSTGWSSFVGQSPPTIPGSEAPKRLVLRFVHSELESTEELVRVRVTIEQTATPTGNARVRINGHPVAVQQMESISSLKNLLDESPGASAVSLATVDTTTPSHAGSSDGSTEAKKKRRITLAMQRGISSLIKRNYICELFPRSCSHARLHLSSTGTGT